MDKLERQEYNKKYYAEKKNEILKKLGQKVVCSLCKRKVAHQNLAIHQTKKICLSRRSAKLSEIARLENQIKVLSELIQTAHLNTKELGKMTIKDITDKAEQLESQNI